MDSDLWNVLTIIIAIIAAVVLIFLVVPHVFATYPVSDLYSELPITKVFTI